MILVKQFLTRNLCYNANVIQDDVDTVRAMEILFNGDGNNWEPGVYGCDLVE